MKAVAKLLTILLGAILVYAEVPVVEKIENAIRAAEPGWRCIHAVLNAPPPDVPSEKRLVASVWEHTSKAGRRESVHMLISQVASPADGKLSLESVSDGKVAPGWKVKPYSLGDEGYLSTFRNGSRYEIHFRKDTVVIRVSSDSIRLAERFARYAEAQIKLN